MKQQGLPNRIDRNQSKEMPFSTFLPLAMRFDLDLSLRPRSGSRSPLVARFGPGAMSDLNPQRAPNRTPTSRCPRPKAASVPFPATGEVKCPLLGVAVDDRAEQLPFLAVRCRSIRSRPALRRWRPVLRQPAPPLYFYGAP